METRAKDLARETKQSIKETAAEWTERAKSAGTAAYGTAQEKVKAGAQATDQAIREYPYAALGVAFGCGILIGLLARGRR